MTPKMKGNDRPFDLIQICIVIITILKKKKFKFWKCSPIPGFAHYEDLQDMCLEWIWVSD